MEYPARLSCSLLFVVFFTLPAAAQTVAPWRYIGSWQTYRYAIDNSQLSCQAIQCSLGVCGMDKYFLLFTTPKIKYTVPMFNYGRMVEWATQVKLIIGHKTFILENLKTKPNKFLEPLYRRDVNGIVKALLALEKAGPGAKFYVIDTHGYKRQFAARGTREVLREFKRSCKTPLP